MSYILDALKKSEAERSNRDHPEFAHRVPFEPALRKKREIWPYLLVLALLANALVVVYVMWPQPNTGMLRSFPENRLWWRGKDPCSGKLRITPRNRAHQREAEASAPSRATEASEATEVPEVSGVSETSEAPAPTIPADSPSQASAEASPNDSPEPPDIREMPRSVQRRVPEMTFNAHLHSSNPSSRV